MAEKTGDTKGSNRQMRNTDVKSKVLDPSIGGGEVAGLLWPENGNKSWPMIRGQLLHPRLD
jgi:hypothetical protein